MLTKHAQRRLQERGKPFGLGVYQATKMIDRVLASVPVDEALVVLAESTEKVNMPDGSNGNLLCAIIRNHRATTVLLRRVGQSRLDNLPYVIASTLEVI